MGFLKKQWFPLVIGFVHVGFSMAVGTSLIFTTGWGDSLEIALFFFTLLVQLALYMFGWLLFQPKFGFEEFYALPIALILYIGLYCGNVFTQLGDYTYLSREHRSSFINLNLDGLGIMLYVIFSFCALFVSCIISKLYLKYHRKS